jgi:hypothetical protein
MKHRVPQPVRSEDGIATLEKIVLLQIYGGQMYDPHTEGYLQAVGEIAVCVVPYMLQSDVEKVRAAGEKLSSLGFQATIAREKNKTEPPR